ncbi:MAG: hypothetical protein LBD54_02205 [Puniceicoccales bacterium]|jgi:tetratricopeptide (TPR) repeat protein|nr:hypothetical protein [Puniceicoccales bacterium]
MRVFSHLSNIFLLGAVILNLAIAGEDSSIPSDEPEISPLSLAARIANAEAGRRKALAQIQQGALESALLIYEALLPEEDIFTSESYATLLGQYVWLRLQLALTEKLGHFLLLKIQARPELLRHLPTWEALWNVVQALSAQGKFEKALQFFQNGKALAEGICAPSEEVEIYHLFVETYLLFQCHYTHTSHLRAKELLDRYHALRDPSLREHIHSSLLLYLGELEILLGNEEVGRLHLRVLRERFPQTPNDIRSRLFLAEWDESHASAQESHVSARESLSTLEEFVEKNPRNPFTPRLLYASAQRSRRRGFKSYPQAIGRLETIIYSHPESAFCLSAKLLEGELLRELHQFFGAQLLYEDLLKRPGLSAALRAWIQLLRLRCVLALHPHDPAEQMKALSLLSSVVDGPQIPKELQAEIRFQQVWLLFENHRFSELRQAISRVASDLLSNPSLSPKERYWIRRMLSIAQQVAREEKDAESGRKLNELQQRLAVPRTP